MQKRLGDLLRPSVAPVQIQPLAISKVWLYVVTSVRDTERRIITPFFSTTDSDVCIGEHGSAVGAAGGELRGARLGPRRHAAAARTLGRDSTQHRLHWIRLLATPSRSAVGAHVASAPGGTVCELCQIMKQLLTSRTIIVFEIILIVIPIWFSLL